MKLSVTRLGLILALFSLSACKSTSDITPIQLSKTPEWTWLFTEPLTKAKNEYLRQKVRNAYLYEWDAYNNKYFDKELSTSALYQPDGSVQSVSEFSCEQKLAIAKVQTVKKLSNIKIFDYELIYNTATGTGMHPQRNISLQEGSEVNTYLYTDTMLWKYGSADTGLKGVGVGKAMINITYNCNKQNNVQSIIKVTNMSTSNPIVDLGFTQEIAHLFVSKKVENDSKKLFTNTFYIGDNKYQVDRLLNDLINVQNKRFSMSDRNTIEYSSWNHGINFKIAVSRIQRKFTKLNYNKETNSFWHEENVNIKGVKIIVRSTYSLFPEKNDSTQIVSNATYRTLFDNMQNKMLFSDDDAEVLIKETRERIKVALDKI